MTNTIFLLLKSLFTAIVVVTTFFLFLDKIRVSHTHGIMSVACPRKIRDCCPLEFASLGFRWI